MKKDRNPTARAASEIEELAARLNPKNRTYILNTIHALLYSQQTEKTEKEAKENHGGDSGDTADRKEISSNSN